MNSPCSAAIEEHFHFDLLSPKFVGRLNVADPVLINRVRVDWEGQSNRQQQPVVHFEHEPIELYGPRKLLDLEGRYVKIATFNYYPYSSYEEVVSWPERVENEFQSEASDSEAPGSSWMKIE